jgi:preprotein translocase subunit SecG
VQSLGIARATIMFAVITIVIVLISLVLLRRAEKAQ